MLNGTMNESSVIVIAFIVIMLLCPRVRRRQHTPDDLVQSHYWTTVETTIYSGN